MKIAQYIPDNDIAKTLWLQNFATKLPQYSIKYPITPQEVNVVQQFSEVLNYWLNANYQLEEFKLKLTQYKYELILGSKKYGAHSIPPVLPDFGNPPVMTEPITFKHIRSISKRIKGHYGYTLPDGIDLGIVPVNKIKIDLDMVKPGITVRLVDGGKPRISWIKNTLDGVELYMDRGNGYQQLAICTRTNYIDKHPLEKDKAEIWKYKAVYRHDDQRQGEWSDEVSITVTGHK